MILAVPVAEILSIFHAGAMRHQSVHVRPIASLFRELFSFFAGPPHEPVNWRCGSRRESQR